MEIIQSGNLLRIPIIVPLAGKAISDFGAQVESIFEQMGNDLTLGNYDISCFVRVNVNFAENLDSYADFNQAYTDFFKGGSIYPVRAAYAIPASQMPNGCLITMSIDLVKNSQLISVPEGTMPEAWNFPFSPVLKVEDGGVERYLFSGIIPELKEGKLVHNDFMNQGGDIVNCVHELLKLCKLSVNHVCNCTALIAKNDDRKYFTPKFIGDTLSIFNHLTKIEGQIVAALPFGSLMEWVIEAKKKIS